MMFILGPAVNIMERRGLFVTRVALHFQKNAIFVILCKNVIIVIMYMTCSMHIFCC